MDHQGRRIILLQIDQQDDHLAAAVIGSVVWAGTFRMCPASNLQVECLHNTKIGADQFFHEPGQYLIASLIENQKRQ
jgi:hypothetical protein